MPITRSRTTATALLRPAATTLCLSVLIGALASAGQALAAMPERGMSQTMVQQQFGAPAQVRAPVGQPPITRWVYPDFTVYFEGHYALHAVSHHAPPSPAPAPAPAAEAAADAEPAQRPAFRFDPASGQIIELDKTGNDVAPPTPVVETPPEAVPPAPVAASEPAQDIRTPDQDAPLEAAPPETAGSTAEDKEPRFRFDPVSGRIIMDDATPVASTDVAPVDAAPAQGTDDSPAAQADTSQQADSAPEPATGGFRMQW